MNPENALLVATIGAGLASVCTVLSLWSFVRLASLESRWRDLDAKLPPRRVRELEEAFDSMVQAFESLQQKNQEFKQATHNSVNRLDQVMRRNEKAVALLDQEGNLNGDALPDAVRAPPPPGEGGVDEVQANKQRALQARWNRNRGITT